ncbi:MAG TPA: OmpH family outer membrane protein [Candidatus Competibacteraceae bacterium]|nr:OmpH family outer membrane protein [Candidatus Competibacteraceae bacterium]
MARYLAVLLLAAALAAAGHAAELKIGVVNIQKLMDEAPQAQTARGRLEQEFAPRDKLLVDAQRSLRRLEDRLTKEGESLSDEERRSLEREIAVQKRELRRATDEFREDFTIRRNEELSKLQRQIYETIVELAKQQGYDLILESGVIYASGQVDITEQVLQRLSK